MNHSDAVVYIVDDDPGARASVKALVESHGTTARDFSSAETFLEALVTIELPYGCIVADVRMKGMSGLELLRRLIADSVPLPIIIITAYANVPMAVHALQAGAFDFLTKPCEPDRLWSAITHALETDRQQRGVLENRQELQRRLESLTDDERDVLSEVLAGLPNKRIARDLDIGLRTVELRRSVTMKKMGANSLAELVRLAITAGFPAPSLDDDLADSTGADDA